MNRLRYLLDRTSCIELKRLQSSLSVSNSKVKIPTRIQRGPTDILETLEQTIPKDFNNISYSYHDDPYLIPHKKSEYRNFMLSYEAGRKAAQWIHDEHKDLFPKHLSEPEIEAFSPLSTYTDKSQVSEEILLRVISKRIVPDALNIYKLLDYNVSNDTKQMLLELLCFYNGDSNSQNNSRLEEWFASKQDKYIWQYMSEINELFEFLKMQDSSTAVTAYNTMICGLAKHSRIDEAWILYHKCKEKDIPFNISTYNYLLMLIPEIFGYQTEQKKEYLFDILKSMNKKRVKPNVRTLNILLRGIKLLKLENVEDIAKYLLVEFKRMNIKFSLASYYYLMHIFMQNNATAQVNFKDILRSIRNRSFSIQDPMDTKFFRYAMNIAFNYLDREAGDMIHKLLLTGDNYKFITSAAVENYYYFSYISLVLSTSTPDKFFEFYEELVPKIYTPVKRTFIEIVKHLKHYPPATIVKYLPRLWSDINNLCFTDLPLKFNLLSLMKMDVLPVDSPLKTLFMNAAWDCWETIQKEITNQEKYTPLENSMTACIAAILLHGDRIEESIEVLIYTINKSDLFLPTMNKEQVNELYQSYISKKCILGALLILEYSVNAGFPNIAKMATELHNLPQLTDAYRKKLIDLVGTDALNFFDTKKSN